MTEPRSGFVDSTAKWDLLASSRILLNIHRNEVPYFEWVRVLEAVLNGCLVLTETSTDYGPLVPGEHLVAVPPELLGPYATGLVADEDLRCQIASAAYDFVRTKLELRSLMEPICARIEAASAARHRPRRPMPFAPAGAEPSATPLPGLTAILNTEREISSRVKGLLDGETELLQRVEALQARLLYQRADYADILVSRSWESADPAVSVVITSYNYDRFLREAIHSVMATQEIDVELIVVDDHSQDQSVDMPQRSSRSPSGFLSSSWPRRLIVASVLPET